MTARAVRAVMGGAGPPLAGGVSECGHADLCGQQGLGLGEPTFAEGGGDGVVERFCFGQRPLAERWCRRDNRRSCLGHRTVVFEDRYDRGERGQQHGKRGEVFGGLGNGGDERGAEGGFAVEEHLPLVGEVPEERALGDPCAFGNLRGRGRVVASLQVQLERGLLQPAPRVLTTPGHVVHHSALCQSLLFRGSVSN
jgi:hypothetical protein